MVVATPRERNPLECFDIDEQRLASSPSELRLQGAQEPTEMADEALPPAVLGSALDGDGVVLLSPVLSPVLFDADGVQGEAEEDEDREDDEDDGSHGPPGGLI